MGLEETRFVARWVLDRCRSAYGPHRGLTLLDLDVPELHDSAAAVRDLPSIHPGLAPYRRLVKSVHQTGDQGTMALLLAAGTIDAAYRAMDDGFPVAPLLEGIQLAARQLRTELPARARPQPAESLVGHPEWHDVVAGLRRLSQDGVLDLDDVDLRGDDGPAWSDGLALDLHGSGPRPDARILLLDEGPRRRLRMDAHWGVSGVAAEAELERAFLQRLDDLGVDVLLVATSLGDLRDRVATRCLVQDDVPEELRNRVKRATGAVATRLDEATSQHLGRGDVRHTRRGGWTVHGPGPGATFRIGRSPATVAGLHRDRGERFLRLCATVLADPRGLPGGGRWQSDAAQALRRMADLAPGKAAYGVRCVADAFDGQVRALRLQAGRDAFDAHFDDVLDAVAPVEAAVAAALELAVHLLRIDARHSKKASRGVDLRGGTAPAGSPKGMPGDIPPLM